MTKAPVPLKRALANEFSLYGVRHAKIALEREKKLLLHLIRKDDEMGLRRYLNINASKTKISELNREQVVQVASIFIQELTFMGDLAKTRELAIAEVVNNPRKNKEPLLLDNQ